MSDPSAAASFAAVDLGASSGRVILGRVGPGVLEMTEVSRFRNGPVALPDGLYWDILGLYQDILAGLRDAAKQGREIRGVAIDSWAVDYGLLDSRGSLLGNPFHYRDDRTAAVIDTVHAAVPAEKLYAINGLQFLPFNTLYQFAADPRVHEPGVQALLIPDLLGLLAHRAAGHRGHQRLHHRPARRRHRAMVQRAGRHPRAAHRAAAKGGAAGHGGRGTDSRGHRATRP